MQSCSESTLDMILISPSTLSPLLLFVTKENVTCLHFWTRRPTSADGTARRQFQFQFEYHFTRASVYSATADTWSCHLPNRNVCATQVFPMGVGRWVPMRSDIKGTELTPANILIPLERQLIALQLCRWLCSRLLVLYCRNCPTDDKFRYLIPILRKLGAA